MRVLALMKYGPLAASTRQRLLQYTPYLSAHGVEFEMAPLLGDSHVEGLTNGRSESIFDVARAYAERLWQIVRARDFDVIWVHYEAFPYLPGLFERLVGLTGKPVIYDFDDAVFHMYDDHPNSVVRMLLGGKLKPLLRAAAACSCGNAYLQAYAARFCANHPVIPTVVDTSRYLPLEAREPNAPPVLGWIGSPSTWQYVESLVPTLLPILEKHGARFRVVGAGHRAEGIAGIEAVAWSEAEEIAQVQAMDIGIMPLPDEAWARGKCGYKLIQYMACGLPVITSPVGVNRDIVEDGVNGILATTAAEWTAALDRLLGDAALRQRMGGRGRERVVERYSLASQEPRVLALIQSAMASARTPKA